MSNSIQYLQSVTAYSAAESSSGKVATGGDEIKRAGENRKKLESTIKEKQVDLDQLQAKLEKINDKPKARRIFVGLFGKDFGAGKVSDKMGTASAEMKLAQEQILVQQTAIELTLNELQGAQAELGARSAERMKVYDEVESAIVAMMG